MAENPVTSDILTIIEIEEDGSIAAENKKWNDDKIYLELYGFNGNLVRSRSFHWDKPGKSYKMDISKLSGTNYFIRIICDEVNEVYQVLLN